MNRKLVFNYIGRILQASCALLFLPLIVALIYKETLCAVAFLASCVICLAAGLLLTLFSKPESDLIFAKEGFAIVALGWLAMSLAGALPFIISKEIPHFADAFFETVSGFTTTGASILTNVEAMSKSMLFWRSFTHWIGGMGVLVFVIAILPNLSDRSVNIMKAEVPGPIFGKIVPKAKQTAKILYLIYIAITGIETIFLLFGGMNLFESLLHSFGTAGTGGFGIRADSIASYSPYIQWVITVFMLVFGVNFNLYYYFLAKRSFSAFKSTEFKAYLLIVLASTGAICINIYNMFGNFLDSLRHAAFQVSSIITTTGYVTIPDINTMPDFSKAILLILMFIGGCAGSTAGGLKVSRVVLLVRMVKSEIKKMLHPKAITTVRFEGKSVDEGTLHSVSNYIGFFLICYAVIFLAICLLGSGIGFETNFTAVATCINNVGPGFGKVASNFAFYSPAAKLIFSFAMLLGRLEIYPLLLTFIPKTWTKD